MANKTIPLTFEELQELAMQHYNEGGDAIVECWDEQVFREYVEDFGEITEQRALELIGVHDRLDREYRAAAGYFSGETLDPDKRRIQELERAIMLLNRYIDCEMDSGIGGAELLEFFEDIGATEDDLENMRLGYLLDLRHDGEED